MPASLPGFFSETNWGNCIERCNSQDTPVKSCSNILKLIKKLNDIQWEKILQAATSLTKQKKTVPISSYIDIPNSSDSDFELKDGDEDLKPVKVEAVNNDNNDLEAANSDVLIE
jgi:hypothetical protein